MTGRTFIRKHKPSSKQKAEKTARVAAEKSATTAPPTTHAPSTTPASSATPQNQNLGMNYQSGPVFNLAAAELERAQNDEQFIGQTEPSFFEKQLDAPPNGAPLELAQRRQLERRFGRSFAHVQIHKGPLASALTETVGATAFAYRQHIWLGDRADKSDTKLLAHELTHVVQQGYAPDIQYRTPIALNPPANDSTHAVGQQAAAPNHAPALMGGNVAPAGGVIQGFDLWDAAVELGGDAVNFAGNVIDTTVDFADDLLERGIEGARTIMRAVAPDFLAFFDRGGIVGMVNGLIIDAIDSLFSGVFDMVQRAVNMDGFASGFEEATAWFENVSSHAGEGLCDFVLSTASHIGSFFSDTFGPVIDEMSSIACKVKGFLSGIWDSISVPIWDFLQEVGGPVWREVQELMNYVGELVDAARDALGPIWNTAKQWFGIEAEDGTSEGGGIWDWISGIAADIGHSISEVIRPVMGPLRDAAGVLLLLVPGGQIIAVMLLWPRLRQAFEWLTGVWEDLNLIPRASQFLTGTVFPFLMDIAESIGQTFLGFADWLVGGLSNFLGIVQRIVGSIPSILNPLRPVVTHVLGLAQKILGFARSGIRKVSRNFRSILRRLIEFIQLVGRVLLRIISIALNPFGLVGFLVGTLWNLLPDCLKGPLINFILDILIGFIRLIPNNPLLGILWPLIKNGFLGFLETVRTLELKRKVNVSNKMANIIAGGSPSFIVGYFLGIIEGLWNAVTGPFQALGALFELPTQIQAFLGNLGVRLCEIVDQVRCFAANLASQVFGSVDGVLSAIREFLSDPARIISLIRCAIDGILSGARALGSQLAQQMIGIFEGPDETMGRMLGGITATILFQAVLGFFTAGAGTAVSSGLTIVNRIAGALRTVGRAIGQVMRVLRGLFGRLISFMRGLASRFGQAVVRGGRSVLSRLGGFFRRFTRWLARIGRRIFRRVSRRFRASAAQRARWNLFKQTVRAQLASHSGGITRGGLRRLYGGIRSRFSAVAKWPAFITKHGPRWRVWARRVRSIRPRIVGRVLLDRLNRWRAGRKAVIRTVRAVRRQPGFMTSTAINARLPRVARQYHYTRLTARFDQQRNEFEIDGGMSPNGTVTKPKPERPTRNVYRRPYSSRHAIVDPLVKRNVRRTDADGDPPHWAEVSAIRAPSNRRTLYIKGHLISGYFDDGNTDNLTPIKESANQLMASRAETRVKNMLPRLATKSGRQPIFYYEVKGEGHGGSGNPVRNVLNPQTGSRECRRVPAENRLYRVIRLTVKKKEFNDTSGQWDREEDMSPGPIDNVPPYPRGYDEDAC